MLMKMLQNSYREVSEIFAPQEIISTVPAYQPAANASRFEQLDARRAPQRRRSRLNRSRTSNLSGWSVRTW